MFQDAEYGKLLTETEMASLPHCAHDDDDDVSNSYPPDLEILISPPLVSRGGSDATGREKEVFISRERLAPPLRGQEQGGGLLEIGLVLASISARDTARL